MKIEISKIVVEKEISILEALQRLNDIGAKTLFVAENDILIGSISDGDVRRGLIKGIDLNDSIQDIYNQNVRYVYQWENIQKAHDFLKQFGVFIVPIVDENKHIIRFVSSIEQEEPPPEVIHDLGNFEDIPIVIMAGGKGTRLDPITRILPKPLIPLGETPMVEMVLNQFSKVGGRTFYLTLNYLGKMIENYFEGSGFLAENPEHKLHYLYEKKFLGTAGGLSLFLDAWKNEHAGEPKAIILSNSDILVDVDLNEVYRQHIASQDILTIITTTQHHHVPYGVIHLNEQNKLDRIEEKPTLTFEVNTGVYFIHPRIFDYIPADTVLQMDTLIHKLLEQNEHIGTFSIPSQSYIDFGQWDEYHKNVTHLTKRKR